jgi:hypothetical protein
MWDIIKKNYFIFAINIPNFALGACAGFARDKGHTTLGFVLTLLQIITIIYIVSYTVRTSKSKKEQEQKERDEEYRKSVEEETKKLIAEKNLKEFKKYYDNEYN